MDAPNCSTINLRILAAASAFASKDETRYYINGVCLEIDERGVTYVATDGHRLVAYRDDLPPDATDNRLTGVFIIPTAHCKPYKLGKDDDAQAKIFGEGRLTISHSMVDLTFVPIDGVFPDWRKTLPPAAASGAIGQFELKRLATFKKFGDELGLGNPFLAHNGDGPAYLWFTGRNDVLGLLMPFRMTDEIARVPQQWARKGPERAQSDIEDKTEVAA
jgi:DNA polymerase-3 subunit beta